EQVNRVALPRVERRHVADFVEDAVDAGAEKAALPYLLEGVAMFAFAGHDERGEDVDLASLFEGKRLLENVVHGLARDGAAALRAMRRAQPGVEQTQMIVNFGEGGEGAAGAS